MTDWTARGVRMLQEPELSQPVLLAAWPGVGNVALRAVSYLREKLEAKLFAEIDPRPFFELPGVFIEDNQIQPPRFPHCQFYFWHRPVPGPDLIFFQGEAQPSHNSYHLAHLILEVAQHLGVQQLYTLAAALISTIVETPRVWATATDKEMVAQLQAQGTVLPGNFFVAGMNGLLLAVARERGLKAVCLLGETFRMLPHVDNPESSLVVLKVLVQALSIEVDTRELETMAQQAKEEIARLMSETRKEFIDHFTVPLWERPDEEEKA